MDVNIKKRIHEVCDKVNQKELLATDYILFNAIKKVFKLQRFNFGEFIILKRVIEKTIKEKRLK